MPGDLVPTLALWTATTFRQQKGSPLRALPTTTTCRVHPCSRLFNRPPVSPSALPALWFLNSRASPEVPKYPSIKVSRYPGTEAWPGPSSTQLMCVYFLFFVFSCPSSCPASPPSSLLIHSAARYSGCSKREAHEARLYRQTCLAFSSGHARSTDQLVDLGGNVFVMMYERVLTHTCTPPHAGTLPLLLRGKKASVSTGERRPGGRLNGWPRLLEL